MTQALEDAQAEHGGNLRGTALLGSRREFRSDARTDAERFVTALSRLDPARAHGVVKRVLAKRLSRGDKAWLTGIAATIDPAPNPDAQTEPETGPAPTYEHTRHWITSQLTGLVGSVLIPGRRALATASPEHSMPLPEGLVASLTDPRSADLLHQLAHDQTLSPLHRLVAACQLARFGDRRAPNILIAYAEDSALDAGRRAVAALWAAIVGDPRGSAILNTAATDSSAPFVHRLSAIERIAELDHTAALGLLDSLAAGRRVWRLDQALWILLIRRDIARLDKCG